MLPDALFSHPARMNGELIQVTRQLFFQTFGFADTLTIPNRISHFVIIIRIFSIFLSFTSTKLSHSIEIFLQVGFAICLAGAQVSLRKLVITVSAFENLPITFVSMWINLIGPVPLFAPFVFQEIPKFKEVLNIDYLILILFGVASSKLFSVYGAVVGDCSGYGFADDVLPLNCLPVLLISYVWYRKSFYVVGKIGGVWVCYAGYVGCSLRREKREAVSAKGDSMLLAETREHAIEEY
jgi:hypothetical protein